MFFCLSTLFKCKRIGYKESLIRHIYISIKKDERDFLKIYITLLCVYCSFFIP